MPTEITLTPEQEREAEKIAERMEFSEPARCNGARELVALRAYKARRERIDKLAEVVDGLHRGGRAAERDV